MNYYLMLFAVSLLAGCASYPVQHTSPRTSLLPPQYIEVEADGTGPSTFLATEHALQVAAARAFGVDVRWQGDWDGKNWEEKGSISTIGRMVQYTVLSMHSHQGGWRVNLKVWFSQKSKHTQGTECKK